MPDFAQQTEKLNTGIAFYQKQLEKRDQEIAYLQQAMQSLNAKYVAEIERAADALHQKDMVEHELEDLSCRLFEQANEMVSHAKRENWHLEQRLKQTEEHLAAEQSQLAELRQRIHHDDQPSNTSLTSMDADSHVQDTMPLPTPDPAFEAFLAMPSLSHPYIQACFIEDIQPCLRFRAISAKALVGLLSRQPCFIEKITPAVSSIPSPAQQRRFLPPLFDKLMATFEDAPMASTLGPPADPNTCACCLATRPLLFRLRLDACHDWVLIDQACRDRLVAACNFYVFVRQILDRRTHMAPAHLYAECIRLRLQMFHAR